MDDAIAHWADLELAPWIGTEMAGGRLGDELAAVAARFPSIFLCRIDHGRITIEDKPDAAFAGIDPANTALFRTRAALYRTFIQSALQVHRMTGRGIFLLAVHDRGFERLRVPVLGFQKQRGANTILLPDVDLIGADFFAAPAFDDPIPFDDKRAEAIFVGSTTGGLLTAPIVAELRHPRLRAAMRFRDEPAITFDLPNIVQSDGPETTALVERLGVGGRRRNWREQAACRYILSMDGNGATCSRVALALRSRAVLVKYASAQLLYYFHGLDAWRHYLPVRTDEDVVTLVQGMAGTIERDRFVAERSRAFALAYLNRDAVTRYTALVLDGYLRLFGEDKP